MNLDHQYATKTWNKLATHQQKDYVTILKAMPVTVGHEEGVMGLGVDNSTYGN